MASLTRPQIDGRDELVSSAAATIDVASDTESVAVPSAGFLTGKFQRIGSDLILIGDDGQRLIIHNYFAHHPHPTLVGPNGAEIDGYVAGLLAGPSAPEQVAAQGVVSSSTHGNNRDGDTNQHSDGKHADSDAGADLAQFETAAGGNAPPDSAGVAGAVAVGRVDTVQGSVHVTRSDGSSVALANGDPVFQGDVLQTGDLGAVGVAFADNTTLSLGKDGRIVLNEINYDPVTQSGMFRASVIQGVFSFVSGQIAKSGPDAMVLDTPVASIGVRGTKVAGEITPDGQGAFSLMPEANGFVGEIVVWNASGLQVLNQVGASTTVVSHTTSPTVPVILSVPQIEMMYHSALGTLPAVPAPHDTKGNSTAPHTSNDGNYASSDDGADIANLMTAAGGNDNSAGNDAPIGDWQPGPHAWSQPPPPSTATTPLGVNIDLGRSASNVGAPLVGTESLPPIIQQGGKASAAGATTSRQPLASLDGDREGGNSVDTFQDQHTETATSSGQTGGNAGSSSPAPTNSAPNVLDSRLVVDEDGAVTTNLLVNAGDPDGDALSLVAVGAAQHGTVIKGDGGTIQYRPEANYHGTDSFAYTVSDNHGHSAAARMNVTVNDVNDLPIPGVMHADVPADRTMVMDLTAVSRDVDGDRVTLSGVDDRGTRGRLSVDTSVGTVRYEPGVIFAPLKEDETASDSFSYAVSDGHGVDVRQTVTVTVIGVNDAPVSSDDAAILQEDSFRSIDVLGNDRDIEADSLHLSAVGRPAHGTATIDAATGQVLYTPTANYFGSDSFTYVVSDGQGGTSTSTVQVDVTAVNDAPTIGMTEGRAAEHETIVLDVLRQSLDVEGDSIRLTALGSKNTHGLVAIVDNNALSRAVDVPRSSFGVSSNPNVDDRSNPTVSLHGKVTNYSTNNDTDCFRFTVQDGERLIIDVDHAAGEIPSRDHFIWFLDQNGNRIADYTAASTIDRGTLPGDHFITSGVLTVGTYFVAIGAYTSGGYELNVSIVPTVDSTGLGIASSSVADEENLSLTNDTMATAQDVVRSVFGISSDPDVDNHALPTASIHGTLRDRDADYYRFTVQDGERLTLDIDHGYGDGAGRSVNTTLKVYNSSGAEISYTNAASGIDSGSVSSQEPFITTKILTGGDYYVKVSGDSAGDYVLNASIVPSSAQPGSTGLGETASSLADVDSTSITNDTLATAQDVPRSAFGATSDPDVDNPALPTTIIQGTLALNSDNDYYRFTVQNGESLVLDIDHGYNDGFGRSVDTEIEVYDSSGNSITYSDDSIGWGLGTNRDPFIRTDTLSGGTYYVRVSGYNLSPDSMTSYTGGDYVLNASIVPVIRTVDSTGFGATSGSVADVEIPFSTNNLITTAQDVPRSAFGATSDPDVDNQALPTVRIQGTTFATGDDDYYRFTVQDGERLVLDIDHGSGDGPGRSVDIYMAVYTSSGTLIRGNDTQYIIDSGSVSSCDSFIETDVLTAGTYYVRVFGSEAGDYVLNASILPVSHSADLGVSATDLDEREDAIRYTADPNLNDLKEGETITDSFTYTLSDGHGGTSTQTVAMTIVGTNENPVASGDTARMKEDGTVSIAVLANDTDVDHDVLRIQSVNAPAHGTATIDALGQNVVYTPNPNYNGTDSFSYSVSDGHVNSSTATVAVTVTAENDRPVTDLPNSTTVSENGTTVMEAVARVSDMEGDHVTLVGIDTTGTRGQVSIVAGDNYSQGLTVQRSSFGLSSSTDINDRSLPTVSIHGTMSQDYAAPSDYFTFTLQAGERLVLDVDNGNGYDHPANTSIRVYNGTTMITENGGTSDRNALDPGSVSYDDPLLTTGSLSAGTYSVKIIGFEVGDYVLNASIVPTMDSTGFGVDAEQFVEHAEKIIYEPSAVFGYLGVGETAVDTFIYALSDGQGGVTTQTMTVTVTGTDDAPVDDAPGASQNSHVLVVEDGRVAINVSVRDESADEHSLLHVTGLGGAAHGTAVVDAVTGQVVYTPTANYNGSDSFTYTVSDGSGEETTTTVEVGVLPVNDAPIPGLVQTTVDENISRVLDVAYSAIDPDGNPFSINIVPMATTLGQVTFTTYNNNSIINAQEVPRSAFGTTTNPDVGDLTLPSVSIQGIIKSGSFDAFGDYYRFTAQDGER